MTEVSIDQRAVYEFGGVTDRLGHVARYDGAPQWALEPAGLATLEVSDDGHTAIVISGDQLGALVISVTIDADLGDGIRPVIASDNINIVAGEARGVSMSPARIEPKPETPNETPPVTAPVEEPVAETPVDQPATNDTTTGEPMPDIVPPEPTENPPVVEDTNVGVSEPDVVTPPVVEEPAVDPATQPGEDVAASDPSAEPTVVEPDGTADASAGPARQPGAPEEALPGAPEIDPSGSGEEDDTTSRR